MACNFAEPSDFQQGAEEDTIGCPHGNKSVRFEEPVQPMTISGEPRKENPALQPSVYESNRFFNNVTASVPDAIHVINTSSAYDQSTNTEHLNVRARSVAQWQGSIQALVTQLREETVLLETQKRRLKCSLAALQIPEAIVAECRSRRTARIGHDNVHDMVDTALDNEKMLCQDIRETLTTVLKEVETQLESNKICKVQLEFDWSDKTESYWIETTNVGLRNNGAVSYYPGATRLQTNQSTPEHWLHYTKELISQGQFVLERSHSLRARLDEIITRAVTDLRASADTVELSLQRNLAVTQAALQDAEGHLMRVLGQIMKSEELYAKLNNLARHVDFSLKTAQTRLHNRSFRPRAENTRDPAQHCLIDEVKHLNEDAIRIKQEIESNNETLKSLSASRCLLEDKIAVKRKSIYLDRQRCHTYRTRFPDSAKLAGY